MVCAPDAGTLEIVEYPCGGSLVRATASSRMILSHTRKPIRKLTRTQRVGDFRLHELHGSDVLHTLGKRPIRGKIGTEFPHQASALLLAVNTYFPTIVGKSSISTLTKQEGVSEMCLDQSDTEAHDRSPDARSA